MKEVTEYVPIDTLIKERYSVNRRFLANGSAKRDLYRHYRIIGVAKKAEMQSTT